MAKPRRLTLSEFPGLMNNDDPRDIPSGAGQVQVNFAAQGDGLLATRRGFRIAASDAVTLITDLTAEEI